MFRDAQYKCDVSAHAYPHSTSTLTLTMMYVTPRDDNIGCYCDGIDIC